MSAQERPGWATDRLRIRNLPLPYATHAPKSALGLRELIARNLRVHTFNEENHREWKARRQPVSWACLSVLDRADGETLNSTINQIVLENRPLQAQWKHDSWPDLIRTPSILRSRLFPHLR